VYLPNQAIFASPFSCQGCSCQFPILMHANTRQDRPHPLLIGKNPVFIATSSILLAARFFGLHLIHQPSISCQLTSSNFAKPPVGSFQCAPLALSVRCDCILVISCQVSPSHTITKMQFHKMAAFMAVAISPIAAQGKPSSRAIAIYFFGTIADNHGSHFAQNCHHSCPR
jgi:hypothetical protein